MLRSETKTITHTLAASKTKIIKQEQLELHKELKDKPNDLKRYEEKLKQSTFSNKMSQALF